MKKLLFLIFLISLGVSEIKARTRAYTHSINCHHTKTIFKCVNFLHNYDGDTITFNIEHVHPILGNKISIRVYGIDTPEMRTDNPCEKEKALLAKQFVYDFLKKGKRIDLIDVSRGKYFRIVADVIVDGQSLSDLLITKKLAYPYFGDTKQDINWCY